MGLISWAKSICLFAGGGSFDSSTGGAARRFTEPNKAIPQTYTTFFPNRSLRMTRESFNRRNTVGCLNRAPRRGNRPSSKCQSE